MNNRQRLESFVLHGGFKTYQNIRRKQINVEFKIAWNLSSEQRGKTQRVTTYRQIYHKYDGQIKEVRDSRYG